MVEWIKLLFAEVEDLGSTPALSQSLPLVRFKMVGKELCTFASRNVWCQRSQIVI